MASYRQIGGVLGAYIRANNPSTQQIQGLLADLLTSDELLLPMRDLVSRKCFINLQPFAGSGGGIVQRDACLQELSRSYLPIVVDQISQVINGMLDQPAQNTRQPQEVEGSRHPAGTEKSTQETKPSTDKAPNKDLREVKGLTRNSEIPLPRNHPAKPVAGQKPINEKRSLSNQFTQTRTRRLVPAELIIGLSIVAALASFAWATVEASCENIASKASRLQYSDTSEFRDLILESKDRCMINDAFARQFYRGSGVLSPKCITKADGSCIYEKPN
jgi:hypothetical protein